MAFDGKEGEQVSLDDAARWTENYRNANSGAIKAHTFGKTNLNDILNQNGCVGIRIYHGIDDSGVPCLVLVGVTAEQTDLTTGIVLERGVLCPPYCDNNSPLNG